MFFMDQNQEIIYNSALIKQLVRQHQHIEIIGLAGSQQAYLTAKLYNEHHKAFLVILPTVKQAERFFDDLQACSLAVSNRNTVFQYQGFLSLR